MVTNQFGAPAYIAPAEGGSTPNVTANKHQAALWYEEDHVATKLAYHKAVTGWSELRWEEVDLVLAEGTVLKHHSSMTLTVLEVMKRGNKVKVCYEGGNRNVILSKTIDEIVWAYLAGMYTKN